MSLTAPSLGAEWVDLEDITAAVTQCGIDHNCEVVVKVLGEILAQLGRDDALGIVVIAVNPEINVAGVIQNVNLCLLGGGRGIEKISLPEVSHGRRSTPDRIIQSAIQPRRAFGPRGLCHSGHGHRRLHLPVQQGTSGN